MFLQIIFICLVSADESKFIAQVCVIICTVMLQVKPLVKPCSVEKGGNPRETSTEKAKWNIKEKHLALGLVAVKQSVNRLVKHTLRQPLLQDKHCKPLKEVPATEIKIIMLQLHVKGIDGKTYTVNLEGGNPLKQKVTEVKRQIKAKTGIDPDSQRLIYGGKQMEDEKCLEAYPTIGHGATIYLVLRLPGGFDTSTRHIDPTLRQSKEPCMITFEQDCPEFPVFVMPCGHSMSPDGLMDYCWSEIGSRKCEIRCPLCNTEWTIDVTCKYGCATKTEIHELEAGLSRNFCLSSQEILECPSCTSFCERKDCTKLRVECIICTKKKVKTYSFCWQCLGEWKNRPGDTTCGNTNCGDPVFLRQLKDAPMVKPMGMKVECPKLRACPNCGTVIDLESGCKHMTCTCCNTDFCFVCLRTKASGSWSCGSYNTSCTPAPRQTRIPLRSK